MYLYPVVAGKVKGLHPADGKSLVLNRHVVAQTRRRIEVTYKVVIPGKPSLVGTQHEDYEHQGAKGDDHKETNYLVGKTDS
jgi:hypothetical protein